MQEILINWAPQETRVAVVENGTLQELQLERSLERGLVGNIYIGKVVRVLPGMQSAFVDIGLERAAFLHVADVHDAYSQIRPDDIPPPPPIEKRIFEGQSLMVQVIKDPISTKGARLSTQISIAGRMLVYLPQDNHIGVSQKITPPEHREALRVRLEAIAHAQGTPTTGGFILRTNGEDASDDELSADMAFLKKTWNVIREQAMHSAPGDRLYEDLNLMQRVLRDLTNDHTHVIRVDSKLQFEALMAFGRAYTPKAADKLELYVGGRPLFDLYDIEQDIQKALARRVDLKSGGYLIFDQTEALTAIDVNTGGFVGGRSFDETIFKTNLEAAHSIARQLRLRNLGGIIIIDFIDMTREDHQQAVLAELHKEIARDRVKTTVSGFTQLGLVEMTRKRTRDSLSRLLCEPCHTCQGRGQVLTARTVCYNILREIMRDARQFDAKEFRVIASPTVIEMLLDEENQHLAGLIEFIGKPISLGADTAMSTEQYDIVLL